jgi:hypothetical protein
MCCDPAARECAFAAPTACICGSSVNVCSSFAGSRSWFLYFEGAKRERDMARVLKWRGNRKSGHCRSLADESSWGRDLT